MNKDYTALFKIKSLDPVSPTFCAAKWLDATIWLSDGYTTSCHHNPLHGINLEEIKKDPSALHNTAQKRVEREMMVKGEQPIGCQYCWKIENETKSFSDRVYKSHGIGSDNIVKLRTNGLDKDPQPKTLEISFDNVCNMSCMYCNQTFSNKWSQDLKKFGPYKGITSDHSGNYIRIKEEITQSTANQYVDAFWRWWPDLKKNLKWFRITGGEPLLNENTWKIIEDLSTEQSSLELYINTNLNHKPNIIEKLLAHKNLYPNIMLFSSLESMGAHAEYIRDGLDFELWKSNLENILNNNIRVHIMTTVNIFSLDTITDFYEYMIQLQEQGKRISYDCNLLRYPSFLSIAHLPKELKDYYLEKITQWYNTNKHRIVNETHHVEKLINYISSVDNPDYNIDQDKGILKEDLKRFIKQYDIRRNKVFSTIFDRKLVEWIVND